MFKIPSKVREELDRSGYAETSRYVYFLHDCSDIEPGLVFCVRSKRPSSGMCSPEYRDCQRRLF